MSLIFADIDPRPILQPLAKPKDQKSNLFAKDKNKSSPWESKESSVDCQKKSKNGSFFIPKREI
jgi:hypothetical protein